MELLIFFLIFLVCMVLSILNNITMLLPLGIGFVLFTAAAVHRGFSLRQVLRLAADSLKESMIVVRILLLIGCLTGMWRLSGTVAYFVSAGISLIPPQLFILAAFLLSAAMSYALGTSFGVSATAGVILMSIARAGGADSVLTAGAILSGVYVGDRGSPSASSANLVSVLTHTDMRENVRKMLKCSLLPFTVCCLLYGLISLLKPVQEIDTAGDAGRGPALTALCRLSVGRPPVVAAENAKQGEHSERISTNSRKPFGCFHFTYFFAFRRSFLTEKRKESCRNCLIFTILYVKISLRNARKQGSLPRKESTARC